MMVGLFGEINLSEISSINNYTKLGLLAENEM